MTQVRIEVSARHCHISKEHLAILFGSDAELTEYKPLSQTGQFAANERITVQTDKGKIEGIRILGPARSKTQIEVSRTDARKLKIAVPTRHSGNTEGTPGALLIGPAGEVSIDQGIIVAQRHIHCDTATAEANNLQDGQIVSVRTGGDRSVIFENVLLRVRDDFTLAMHIDTDEGNASMPDGVCGFGEILA